MKLETMKQMGETYRSVQPLCVTFAPDVDGINVLSALAHYAEKGYVRFDSGLLLLHAILATQNWGLTQRKLIMYFTFSLLWEEEGFLQFAERGIESIKVACDSPLNALQSGKQKRREEARGHIAKSVLTPDLLQDFADWGLTVEHSLVEVHGLFTMWVVVKSGGQNVFSVGFDGWSGNIISSEGVVLAFCSSYQTAADMLRKKLDKYLEQATA